MPSKRANAFANRSSLAAMALFMMTLAVSAFGQTPPYGCTASIDKTSLPSAGGTANVTLTCPAVATGVRADLFETVTPYPVDSYLACPASPAFSRGSTVTAPPNPGPTAQVIDYRWQICNCASTACAYTSIVSLTVQPPGSSPLTLLPSALPTGAVGVPYDQPFTATGGTAPYTFSVVGALPPGLAFSAAGVLSGTPTAAGASTFSIRVDDAGAHSSTLQYTVQVLAPPQAAPTNCVATINDAKSVALAAGGGSVALAVTGCTPGTGLTYDWSRNGSPGASNAAAFTDTPSSNPLLAPNVGTTYHLSSYQVTICAGTACIVAPPAASKGTAMPLTALVSPASVALPALVSVLEFYNANLDHYFITWLPDEIAKLVDGTVIKGWQLTGSSFGAYNRAQGQTSPVCRYYIPPPLGDSHFFGRGPKECVETGQKNPSFTLEEPNFMHLVLPVAGVCPGGTNQIYRVFSNRADANHRYMTDKAIRSQMTSKGWLEEGDGPDLVVMCEPTAPPGP